MKLTQFILLLLYISYSLPSSPNQFYYLQKYKAFEQDPSSPTYTMITTSDSKDTSLIYLIYKSNDKHINDELLYGCFDEISDFNYSLPEIVKGQVETKKGYEYIYEIHFVIPKVEASYIIAQNLLSNDEKIVLENKSYFPLFSKIGCIAFYAIIDGAIILGKLTLNEMAADEEENKKEMNKNKSDKKKG